MLLVSLTIFNQISPFFDSYLVNVWSSVFVCGSKRNRAGALNGPKPRAVPAVTLTEYLMPAVRLASRMEGECESTVMLVRMRDPLPPLESKPRTTTW